MATRFNADNEFYLVDLGLGSGQQNFTVCMWARARVDRNDFSTFWSLEFNSGGGMHLQTRDDGLTVMAYDDWFGGEGAVGPTLTVDRWMFFAVSVEGDACTLYWRGEDDTSLATASWTTASSTRPLLTLRIGSNAFNEWLDGSVESVKMWTAALLEGEVLTESQQLSPARSDDLELYCPLAQPETVDYSGKNHAITGGAGTTEETGPDIHGNGSETVVPARVWNGADWVETAVFGWWNGEWSEI